MKFGIKQPTTKFITYTAVMLALMIVIQNLRFLIGNSWASTLIIGAGINFLLFYSTEKSGLISGIVLSIIVPVIALWQGHISIIYLLPVVMLGNAVLVFAYEYLVRINLWLSVIVSSIIKGIFIFLSTQLVIWQLLPGLNQSAMGGYIMSFAYSWPQIITALVGGIIFAIYVTKNNPVV